MFVILVTIDCNSFDLDFPEVHVHVLLINIFFIVGAIVSLVSLII